MRQLMIGAAWKETCGKLAHNSVADSLAKQGRQAWTRILLQVQLCMHACSAAATLLQAGANSNRLHVYYVCRGHQNFTHAEL